MSTSTAPYYVTLRPMRSTTEAVAADDVEIHETRFGGWWGRVRTAPALARMTAPNPAPDLVTELFSILGTKLIPGQSVAIYLETGGGRPGSLRTVHRTWPSMITGVAAHSADMIYDISFCDPLTYWARQPIWGAYQDCTPGNLLGGAVSLASGGDGRPTLQPAVSGQPRLRISEFLRNDIQSVPYAIAAGRPLMPWLGEVFGRLGVRIQMLGYAGGQVGVSLLDNRPLGHPIDMTIAIGPASATNADVIATRLRAPDYSQRATVLDDPTSAAAARVGLPGAVESVLSAPQASLEESVKRAGFARERMELQLMRLLVRTQNPNFTPGRLLRFTNYTVNQSDIWQVGGTTHYFTTQRFAVGRRSANARGTYANQLVLEEDGLTWRPPVPRVDAPVVVSGIVDDGTSKKGVAVTRDRQGRIPIRFPFLPIESGTPPAGWPPRISLSVVEPMAGQTHGFVPGHRQGDACRVTIQNPMFAEIVGFGYRDDRRIGEEKADVSTGVVVRRKDADDWSGLLFRPREDLEEEAEGSNGSGGSGGSGGSNGSGGSGGGGS